MRILFLCTAHNSLSQRLHTVLSAKHYVTIEYALSEELMVEAAEMVKPDLIICPFLTTIVPDDVYSKFLTLIVHPGPPGDAGPSSIDWLLMGDDGSEPDSNMLLQKKVFSESGRSHWGVTVLQATAELDRGPVWAFDQFPVDIDDCRVTKSTLYRGPVTRSAVAAVLKAIERIEHASSAAQYSAAATISPAPTEGKSSIAATHIWPGLQAKSAFEEYDVTRGDTFKGGKTQRRPLLRAAQRDFHPSKHTAAEISRRIRSADSQPGCLSSIFGPKLYLYGGLVETGLLVANAGTAAGSILAYRQEAVCFSTCDSKGIWITHIRRPKKKEDLMIWPKIPAIQALRDIYKVDPASLRLPPTLLLKSDDAVASSNYIPVLGTFQEIWIENDTTSAGTIAYVHFNFYNGAMSTTQCKRLHCALEHLARHSFDVPLAAVVLMGGSYFSNGIHLNVIDAAADPAQESWLNINAIDDLVQGILQEFPTRGIATIAAIRGNCAAGGVALAAACDLVLAGETVVLNPAYRAMSLYGSEFHTLTYFKRCDADGAKAVTCSLQPLSAHAARELGLVDEVLPGWGTDLDAVIRVKIGDLLEAAKVPGKFSLIPEWKRSLSSEVISSVRTAELAEMAKDFWSPRSGHYHQSRRNFVTKMKPDATPIQFALHRQRKDGANPEYGHTIFTVQDQDVGWLSATGREVATETNMLQLRSENIVGKPVATLFDCYYNVTV